MTTDEGKSGRSMEAVGRLVTSCSFLEACVSGLLRHLLGIDDDLARRLIGEARIGELNSLVRDVARERLDARRFEQLEPLLEEVAKIFQIRAIVAHRLMHEAKGQMRFHNTLTARGRDKIWAYQCTADQLSNLAQHAWNVATYLIVLPFPVGAVLGGSSGYQPTTSGSPVDLRRHMEHGGSPDRQPVVGGLVLHPASARSKEQNAPESNRLSRVAGQVSDAGKTIGAAPLRTDGPS